MTEILYSAVSNVAPPLVVIVAFVWAWNQADKEEKKKKERRDRAE